MRGLRLLGLAGLAALAVAAFTPLANVLNAWMAGQARREPAQAIVVLARGGVDADGVLTNASLRRTLLGVELYWKGLAPVLVFSGGSAADGAGEGEARAELAQGLGVPARAILVAGPVRSTRDEAVVARRLLAPRGALRILLVADPWTCRGRGWSSRAPGSRCCRPPPPPAGRTVPSPACTSCATSSAS